MIRLQEIQTSPMALIATLALKNGGNIVVTKADLDGLSLDKKEMEFKVIDSGLSIQVVDEPIDVEARDIETVDQYIARMEVEKEEAGGEVVHPS